MFDLRVAILVEVLLIGYSIHSDDLPFSSPHDNTTGLWRVGNEEASVHLGSQYPWLIFCGDVCAAVLDLASGITMVVKYRSSFMTFLSHLTRNIGTFSPA